MTAGTWAGSTTVDDLAGPVGVLRQPETWAPDATVPRRAATAQRVERAAGTPAEVGACHGQDRARGLR